MGTRSMAVRDNARVAHDAWMADKVAAGWMPGLVEDPDATPPTHPYIVPFDLLPEDVKSHAVKRK